MTLLPIRTVPDPILRRKARKIREVNNAIRELANNMVATMHEAHGVGLAAPQVGVPQRLFIADPSAGRSADDLIILINPRLVEEGGVQREEEGCLSLPGFTAAVPRPTRLVLEGQNRDGATTSVEGEGLLARVFSHELDHLDGALFVNRLRGIRRDLIVRRVRKLQRSGKW